MLKASKSENRGQTLRQISCMSNSSSPVLRTFWQSNYRKKAIHETKCRICLVPKFRAGKLKLSTPEKLTITDSSRTNFN